MLTPQTVVTIHIHVLDNKALSVGIKCVFLQLNCCKNLYIYKHDTI